MAGTVIDNDAAFEGTLSGKDAQVLGRFKGDIKVTGHLTVGEAARVEATVAADAVDISGHFAGEVRARSVTLGEKARVQGTIDTQVLTVRDGAVLNAAVNAGAAPGSGAAAGRSTVLAPPAAGR